MYVLVYAFRIVTHAELQILSRTGTPHLVRDGVWIKILVSRKEDSELNVQQTFHIRRCTT